MHQIATRPLPPSDLHLLNRGVYGGDYRKDAGLIRSTWIAPPHFQKDRLPTPPADEMATTYQPTPYRHNPYDVRQEVAYPLQPNHANSSTYSSTIIEGRSYPSLGHQTSSSTTTYNRPPSPQNTVKQNTANVLVPDHECLSRRRSTSAVITPSMQIPRTVNNSGGSLAEFAAEVGNSFPDV